MWPYLRDDALVKGGETLSSSSSSPTQPQVSHAIIFFYLPTFNPFLTLLVAYKNNWIEQNEIFRENQFYTWSIHAGNIVPILVLAVVAPLTM